MADKKVIWEGDSLEVLKEFPDEVKQDIGNDLRRLQQGKAPLDSKPMKSIAQGVYELRDADGKTWYRVVYYIKIKDTIYVLHSFTKKSRKTPKGDLNTATERLKDLKTRLQQEKKDGKKENRKK
ncbi:MAG: type II toxin-antitoxin system RelE/ParE family toxin [Bdellovibrionales bacterium]|nr:type II toxin-antitoxin system RelE/ParE family toxin [Bdellovibrionales bacterium]MBT3524827.1 type II toxin-antitoxin system RelE/ParE family toxin [Bdellovibrionales bacterium]MBT7668961.1 type II toxin-antitoxin system RelE/ParE family toxin [Bdellovibrionales bacterium]MBT7767493.1 type II toxin-antitoxin system RelE/ParE family toxin [Bdellovibrionales bacterium]